MQPLGASGEIAFSVFAQLATAPSLSWANSEINGGRHFERARRTLSQVATVGRGPVVLVGDVL